MRILVIGGSRFVGYYLVEAALAKGHHVTMFNRGKSNPGAFNRVEEIYGDRDGGLDVLAGHEWDAVVDTCGYLPRVVRASAEFLKDKVKHYVFISTISVYSDIPPDGIDENGKLGIMEDETTEEITGETYGPLKVLCENIVLETYPTSGLIIRPGLIVGPRDVTHRFGYWVERIARGGEVLAPGDPNALVQFIDVRDLGEWTLRMVESKKIGIYNATGLGEPLTWHAYLTTCLKAIASNAKLTWVDETFLLKHEVRPWLDLPSWLPASDNQLHKTSIRKAIANGLTFRPLETTVKDTLTWYKEWQPPQSPHGPLSAEREIELLKAWHSQDQ